MTGGEKRCAGFHTGFFLGGENVDVHPLGFVDFHESLRTDSALIHQPYILYPIAAVEVIMTS